MELNNDTVQKVWEKARVDSTHDPNEWRKDECGAWIRRTHYGNRGSEYSWEINHIPPGAYDDIASLRPLHWQNNLHTGVGRLRCKMRADIEGRHNREIG